MTGFEQILDGLKDTGNFRRLPACGDEREIIDFSSNDYLGLAEDATLQEEFLAVDENRRIPFTASASRLLASRQEEFYRLEDFLAGLYGRKALLFNSGYHANTGLISSLASLPSTLIVADKLVHASIIDGIVLSKARFTRFRHNDYNHLEKILEKEAANYDHVLIAAESVYSMDGDRCDIAAISAVKRKYNNTLLYIDEAHAVGVEGPRGLGLCIGAGEDIYRDVDVVVGTFGKALASAGAFAVMSETLKDWAVNRARSLIFSTALPPIVCAWTRFVLEKSLEMDDRRRHLADLARQLGDGRYIYPFIIGDAVKTVEMSHKLLEKGLKVLPIRVPTVPQGTERLRISLSAAMTAADVERLKRELESLV